MTTLLPATFSGPRIFVRPRALGGDPLLLYTDTAGGSFVFSDAAHHHFLEPFSVDQDGLAREAVRLPEFHPHSSIPLPLGRDWLFLIYAYQRAGLTPGWSAFDGVAGALGSRWFSGRSWTFDWPAGQLLLRAPEAPLPSGARPPMGLLAGHDFPRLTVEIGGEQIDLVLDTGSMTELEPTAHRLLADGQPPLRAVSAIVESVFRRWRKRFPAWRILDDAEMGTSEAMIEVPSVRLAGVETGPVWFASRPDTKYADWISQWTDRPVAGSLGANALGGFRLTVDYVRCAAVLEATG
ncbi:MAG: hypothetical protein K8T20_06795 [Planctomycetes bacterium]|nr:hypothetical protein [Planctomycetota bacterium]